MHQCWGRRLVLVAGVMCAVLAVSCADERACGPDWCHRSACPSSVEDALRWLAGACDTRDLEVYSRCLDDTYTFEFAEDDWESVGVNAEVPYWTRVADLEAMDSLFSSPLVQSIHFRWNLFMSVEIGQDTARVVTRPDIQLTVDYGDSEPVAYWANYFTMEVRLRRSPATSCWTITKIREMSPPPGLLHERMKPPPVAPMATEPTSWGRIKWMAVKGRFSP